MQSPVSRQPRQPFEFSKEFRSFNDEIDHMMMVILLGELNQSQLEKEYDSMYKGVISFHEQLDITLSRQVQLEITLSHQDYLDTDEDEDERTHPGYDDFSGYEDDEYDFADEILADFLERNEH